MKRRVVAIMLSLTLCMGWYSGSRSDGFEQPGCADSRGRHWLRRQLQ